MLSIGQNDQEHNAQLVLDVTHLERQDNLIKIQWEYWRLEQEVHAKQFNEIQ